MTEPSDDAIESLLRNHFDGPIPDDGFSDSVMQRLPPRRRRAAWPLWCGVVAGIAACWLGLLRVPLLTAGWHDWIRGTWSAPAIAMLLVTAGVSLLALCWTVAEPDSV